MGSLIGLGGERDTYVKDSFWSSQLSGISSGVHGTEITASDFKKKSTFPDTWDFDKVWNIDEGVSYPYLK